MQSKDYKIKFSFVTNATDKDGVRLKSFIPHVLHQFGNQIDELLVVVDSLSEVGRIKQLHGSDFNIIPLELLKSTILDPKVKFINLDYSKLDEISYKWFG